MTRHCLARDRVALEVRRASCPSRHPAGNLAAQGGEGHMSSPIRTRRLVWQRATVLPGLLVLSAAAHAAMPDWASHVTPRLLAVWSEAEAGRAEKTAQRAAEPEAGEPPLQARFDSQGRLQIAV